MNAVKVYSTGTCIGGFTELTELDMDGALEYLQP